MGFQRIQAERIPTLGTGEILQMVNTDSGTGRSEHDQTGLIALFKDLLGRRTNRTSIFLGL